jgi:hypothetical protein
MILNQESFNLSSFMVIYLLVPFLRWKKMNVLKEVVEHYTEQLSYSADPDARVEQKTAVS